MPARTPSSRYCSALSIIRRQNVFARSLPDCMLRTRYAIIGAYDLDLGHLREPVGRVVGLHGRRLAVADLFGDVVVARLAQAVLGAEVVDHQCGGHACGLGDAPKPDVEPLLTPLVDGGVADPGDGRSIVRC